MELIYNPWGEFRWTPMGPVNQIHYHLHFGAPGIFSALLRLKREWDAESNGKLPHLFIPGKTGALVPEFAVEDVPLAGLQPWFPSLQWKTCYWAEHADDDILLKTMYYDGHSSFHFGSAVLLTHILLFIFIYWFIIGFLLSYNDWFHSSILTSHFVLQ